MDTRYLDQKKEQLAFSVKSLQIILSICNLPIVLINLLIHFYLLVSNKNVIFLIHDFLRHLLKFVNLKLKRPRRASYSFHSPPKMGIKKDHRFFLRSLPQNKYSVFLQHIHLTIKLVHTLSSLYPQYVR